MTFAAGLWLALIRAAIVAAITVTAARAVTRWLQSAPQRTRRIAATLLIAIVFTPMLVLGYVYSSGDLTLVRFPTLNELLYALLLCAKFLPIAVGVLYFGPPSAVGDAAVHCAGLVPAGSALSRKRLWMRWALAMQGGGRAMLLAGIAVFLLSFQEFELASLLNGSSGRQASAYSWTIALHEARELRVPMSTIWSRAAVAVTIQLIAIVVGVRVLLRSERLAADVAPPKTCGNVTRILAIVIMLAACLLAFAVPWFTVIRTGFGGLGSLFTTFEFGDELFHSVLFAGASTVLVVIALALFRLHRVSAWLAVACCVPGLMGGLVLALTLIMFAQFYERFLASFELGVSPLPLLLGMVLWLLPMAMLLRWLIGATVQRSAIHTANLTYASASWRINNRRVKQLRWQMSLRGWYWLVMLIFSLAYFELILSVLLAPTSMPSAMALLYNLFHYGQNAVRSAMILVMVAVPVVIVVFGIFMRPMLIACLPATGQDNRN